MYVPIMESLSERQEATGAHPASVGGSPAELGGGCDSPRGQGHWQQNFLEVLLGVSPRTVHH